MKQLVIKDIRLLKVTNLFILFAGIVLGCAGVNTENIYKSKLIYGFSIFIMIYMVSMLSTQYDVKSKIDVVLNSFPVSRYDIVRSRYLAMGFYMLSISAIVFLSSNIYKIIFNNKAIGSPTTIIDVLFVIGLALVFFSLYLPFQYYNIGKAQAFNAILYIILILLPNVISRFGSKIEGTKMFQSIISMDFKVAIIIFASIGVIMYLVSLQISKSIYKSKEF